MSGNSDVLLSSPPRPRGDLGAALLCLLSPSRGTEGAWAVEGVQFMVKRVLSKC